jgi:NAD(P)-dependent dehydrogenase (short-subunit alcohol dehydrogenase family)
MAHWAESLSGRVVVVTGAGQGMGQSFAERLGRAGAVVGLVEIDAELGEQTAGKIRSYGGRTELAVADVRDTAAVAALVEDLVRAYGRLDGLVNNAGVASAGPSEDVSEQEWERVLGIMLTAVFRISQLAGRVMLSQGSGSIVNIASIVAQGGWERRAAYSTAKAGVLSITRTLGVEWAHRGVRVNAVAPGQIETPLNEYVFSRGLASRDLFEARTPMHRFGTPAEVSEVVAFLLSDAARAITAETVVVDGGWRAWGQEPVSGGMGV